jgi:hypothetical protein
MAMVISVLIPDLLRLDMIMAYTEAFPDRSIRYTAEHTVSPSP